MIAPERIMAAVNKHSDTVTLAFLIDLVRALDMRLRVEIVEQTAAPRRSRGNRGAG